MTKFEDWHKLQQAFERGTEELAEEVYQLSLDEPYHSEIWGPATERYPDYNRVGEDTDRASEAILAGIRAAFGGATERLFGGDTAEHERMYDDEIREKIVAGLT